jgi:hypothetical protein
VVRGGVVEAGAADEGVAATEVDDRLDGRSRDNRGGDQGPAGDTWLRLARIRSINVMGTLSG